MIEVGRVTLYEVPNPTYLGNMYQEFLADSIRQLQYYRVDCIVLMLTHPIQV